MASLHGLDPLAYLALEVDDLRIANAIIAARARLDEERKRGELDYLASKTAHLTAQPLTNWLGRNLPRLFKRR